MKETIMAVLTLLLGGGIGAAIVAGINERWKFKAQRKAEKEDREAEKADRTDEISEQEETFQETESKRMENLEKQMAAQSEAFKLILLDRILDLGQVYIRPLAKLSKAVKVTDTSDQGKAESEAVSAVAITFR